MGRIGTISPSIARALESGQTAQMVVCAEADKVFTPKECKRIIQLRETLGWDLAPIPDSAPGRDAKRTHTVDRSVRRTQRTHILPSPDTQWIYDRLSDTVNTANDQAWHFRISYMEPLQLLRYSEGDYFEWHSDLGSAGIASLRKISSTIQLSHPDDFDGGQLQFLTGGKELTPKGGQGKALLFPAYINHRVKPVTRGVRHVLILWTVGKRSMR